MTSQDSLPLPDPRLNNKIAHYDLDEIIADLLSFYNFLPHVSASTIHTAPPDGWPEITASSLAAHSIHKTPEAVALLRHLPYISGEQPWIMITALACDYRRVTLSPTAREKPGWLFDAADKQWPAWVVQLTAGTDREGHHYMLDTTDGTISRYCAGSRFEYPPTYAPDDVRSWRDRECDPETVTLREWLEEWRVKYRQMTTLAVPPDPLYGSPDPYFGDLQAEPGSYNFEEMEGLRKIYREYGWPDTEKYQKEACIQAIQLWWGESQKLAREKAAIAWRSHWEQQGVTIPKKSSTQDIWGRELVEEPTVKEAE